MPKNLHFRLRKNTKNPLAHIIPKIRHDRDQSFAPLRILAQHEKPVRVVNVGRNAGRQFGRTLRRSAAGNILLTSDNWTQRRRLAHFQVVVVIVVSDDTSDDAKVLAGQRLSHQRTVEK